jgi:hypothetical protein
MLIPHGNRTAYSRLKNCQSQSQQLSLNAHVSICIVHICVAKLFGTAVTSYGELAGYLLAVR